MHTHLHTHRHTHTLTHTHLHTHTYTHTYTCTHTPAHTHIYTHTLYTQTHKHTHTYSAVFGARSVPLVACVLRLWLEFTSHLICKKSKETPWKYSKNFDVIVLRNAGMDILVITNVGGRMPLCHVCTAAPYRLS